jgi:hypothetical protein
MSCDAQRIGPEGDRAHCLAYVGRQARALRAEFLGCPLVPVQKRNAPRLRTPWVPKTAEGRRFGGGSRTERSVTGRTPARFCAVTSPEYSPPAPPSTCARDLRRNGPLVPESGKPLHRGRRGLKNAPTAFNDALTAILSGGGGAGRRVPNRRRRSVLFSEV